MLMSFRSLYFQPIPFSLSFLSFYDITVHAESATASRDCLARVYNPAPARHHAPLRAKLLYSSLCPVRPRARMSCVGFRHYQHYNNGMAVV